MKQFNLITINSDTNMKTVCQVEVDNNASLDELQQAIANATGIALDQLKEPGKKSDAKNVTDLMKKHYIALGSEGYIAISKDQNILLVKMLTGKILAISFKPADTVAVLKGKIHALEPDIETDQQRLIFLGKQLDDQTNLSDYNIVDGSNLHLFLRLKRGENKQGYDGLRERQHADTPPANNQSSLWNAIKPAAITFACCQFLFYCAAKVHPNLELSLKISIPLSIIAAGLAGAYMSSGREQGIN